VRRLAVLVAAALAAAAVLALPGSSAPPRLAGPAPFAKAVRAPNTVTINVHIPDEGTIAGTDLWIPFDRIAAQRGRLPSRSTPLAVYCRSGSMSAIAVRTLRRLGYVSIVELRGGMQAWTASGRRLLPAGRYR
jgi:rhodanese-related sulfurtransferase